MSFASYSENSANTLSVSIIDGENSAVIGTAFKCDSPVPAKKAKVSIPKNQADFRQENENKMDATHSNYVTGEVFRCTETNTEEFSIDGTPNQSLDDVMGNFNSSPTSVLDSQFTFFDDAHLESLKKEFDLDSIDGEELVDLDFDDICDELSNMLNDDFPLEENKGPTANLNNELKSYMDKPLDINHESHSILSNSLKDLVKNQQDSSGIISKEEFLGDSNNEKMASRSKTVVEETSSIVSAASLLEKEHSSHTTFAGSETETHTPYTKHEIALTSDSVKLNYDSDACGDEDELVDLDFDDICDDLLNDDMLNDDMLNDDMLNDDMLNDDFPLEENKGTPIANLNNEFESYMDKPLEINLESCSILLNSHKDISENQQDSSGIISRDEFSDNSSYEKMASRSKTLVQETSSIVSAASLLVKEHSSHITFAGSETETHTPYTKHEIALTSDSVKLNYDSDARGDGHRKIEENQSIFNERQIKNKAICVLEENSTITDKKLDEQSINYSAIGSENISFLDKINVTHTEDALISTASYSDEKCIILTTPDMFPDFKEKTPFDDRYFKVQNASIEKYKEKEDTSIKDVLAKVLLTIHNNTNDSDNNGDRKTSEKGLAKTTPQFQNNCLEPVEFKFSEIVPNPSKNIKEMEITRDDAKSIQETPNFVKTDFKPSTQEFHQLQKNTPNGTETVKFQYNSENPLLFSSSSTLRKNLIVDCSYEINTEENSTLDIQKNLPENDHVTKEILRIKQDDLKDFGIQKLENFCCTNIKALTEEVSSNNTVDFSQDSVNSQNSFQTQVTIKDCTGLYPITESEPSRKETSNLLNTDIVLKHLKDLYDIDKSIAQAVLISISELDRKTGVKQSQILNYIKKNQMIPFHPKLHLEISKFLTSACEVGIIKKKAFKFMLSDQVQALAAEHKMEEARVKHLTRSKSRQMDTIEKKLSSPIYSPKLLRYNRAHLKRCSK